MNELIRVAADVQGFCESRRWPFCFIGGLALQRWGEPRETVAVALTLLTGFGGEDPFIRTLLERYEGRIDDAAGFARTNRVLLLRSRSGVGIDAALGGLPFEESVIARASRFAFPDRVPLLTCSAEDLIVLKAFAARGRDWVDIEGIIARQAGTLDWRYIDEPGEGPNSTVEPVLRRPARRIDRVPLAGLARPWSTVGSCTREWDARRSNGRTGPNRRACGRTQARGAA